MLKRQQAESIERQKEQMIAAIYSNPNYGSDDIQKSVTSLEEHYKKALEAVYAPPVKQKQWEPDWENPFWAGAKASYDKQREAAKALRSTGAVAELDERRRRRSELMQQVDQLAPKQ